MPDLQALLARATTLAPIHVVKQLGQGPASLSWQLVTAMGEAVVRVDLPLAARLKLDRTAELVILKQASAAGFAPEPLYADPDTGVLVSRFAPGPTWCGDDLLQTSNLDRLGKRLRQLHDLPIQGKVFDARRIADQYVAQAGGDMGSATVTEIYSLASELYTRPQNLCLCHHDPNAANIIEANPLVLIDWEYAAMGEPLFDLAAVIEYHHLSPIHADALLASWSGTVDADLRLRLNKFRQLYSLLEELWTLAVGGDVAVEQSEGNYSYVKR